MSQEKKSRSRVRVNEEKQNSGFKILTLLNVALLSSVASAEVTAQMEQKTSKSDLEKKADLAEFMECIKQQDPSLPRGQLIKNCGGEVVLSDIPVGHRSNAPNYVNIQGGINIETFFSNNYHGPGMYGRASSKEHQREARGNQDKQYDQQPTVSPVPTSGGR